MMQLSSHQTRLLHLGNLRLALNRRSSSDGVSQIVKDVCGLQAQEAFSAMLGIRARSSGLKISDVENALYHDRSITHTWTMRGTLHFVATQDLYWMLPLFGPIFIAKDRWRTAELGFDEVTLRRGVRVIRDALSNQEPLTRQELQHELQNKGIPTEGQATVHLIYRAALEGVVVVLHHLKGKPTYALLGDRIGPPDSATREAALRELALRYLTAYAPARVEDFAYWSGLPIKDARLGWEQIMDQTIQVEAAGQTAWILEAHKMWLEESFSSKSLVRLLPKFDTYLLGYANRDLVIDPGSASRIHPGGGIIRSVVTIDGRVAGKWELKRRKRTLEVVIEPFQDFSYDIKTGIEAEVADIGRFLGEETTISL